MGLFGTTKASKGTIEEVTEMIGQYFRQRGLDPTQQTIDESEGTGWWLSEGSAKLYVFVQDTPSGPVIRVTSPIVRIPKANQEAFYRKLLDINCDLSSCALATFQDTVLVVAQRPTFALDQEELDSLVWNVAYVADLLDNRLATEFGADMYWKSV